MARRSHEGCVEQHQLACCPLHGWPPVCTLAPLCRREHKQQQAGRLRGVPAPLFLPDVPTTSIVLFGPGSTVLLTRGSKWRATFSHSGEQNHKFSGSRAVASDMCVCVRFSSHPCMCFGVVSTEESSLAQEQPNVSCCTHHMNTTEAARGTV